MLKEVRDDNKENDAEHMKPVSNTSVIYQPAKLNVSRTGSYTIASNSCNSPSARQ
jgi:hypothetical protein